MYVIFNEIQCRNSKTLKNKLILPKTSQWQLFKIIGDSLAIMTTEFEIVHRSDLTNAEWRHTKQPLQEAQRSAQCISRDLTKSVCFGTIESHSKKVPEDRIYCRTHLNDSQ